MNEEEKTVLWNEMKEDIEKRQYTCDQVYEVKHIPVLTKTTWLDVAIWVSFGGAMVLFFIAGMSV